LEFLVFIMWLWQLPQEVAGLFGFVWICSIRDRLRDFPKTYSEFIAYSVAPLSEVAPALAPSSTWHWTGQQLLWVPLWPAEGDE
jgi:hypothetical protein